MNRESFYRQRHAKDEVYGAGKYPMESLLSVRSLFAWASSRKTSGSVNVLDVGCGKGVFCRDFLLALGSRWNLRFGTVTGMDIVKADHDVFGQIPGEFQFMSQDFDGNLLPLEGQRYDLITCNHILEHVFHTEMLLGELRRVVRPDGLCIVSVPNIAAWPNRLLLLFGIQPLGTEIGTESVSYGFWPASAKRHLSRFIPAGHIRDFTPCGLSDLLESCGFFVSDWWNHDPVPLLRLTKWAGRFIGAVAVPGEAVKT